jgi:hypothetical protein
MSATTGRVRHKNPASAVYSARALPFVAAGGGRLMVDGDMKAEHRALVELSKALLNELARDIGAVIKGRPWNELSQSERRMLVRVIFATIEALIYVMKQIALAAHPDPKCPTISEAERAFAIERDFRLAPSGDVEQRTAKIPLETNIRFAFKLLAKAGTIPTALDVSGPEWQSLQAAIKVRDRITHPRSISDLTISDAELSGVMIGFTWVVVSHLKLGNDLKAVLREQSETPSTNE